MTDLKEEISNQILLIAPKLLGESLALQLGSSESPLKVVLSKSDLTRHPCLVIWSLENLEIPSAIQLELRRLQEFWRPAPILLLLPSGLKLKTNDFLAFDCPGLLQDPDLITLQEAINTLRNGGRVVRLKDQEKYNKMSNQSPMGLGQWLLLSGIQQINNELNKLERILHLQQNSTFKELILQGRKRELHSAKNLLYLIWGPLKISVDQFELNNNSNQLSDSVIGTIGFPLQDGYGTNISLRKRDAISVWIEIKNRLEKHIQDGILNRTGTLLALEGLSASRQKGLLIALINQLDKVVNKLRDNTKQENCYKETWLDLQPELRQQALRSMTGTYVRLPLAGELTPIIEHLLDLADLVNNDDELPDVGQMLDPLLLNKPLVVGGQLLPADDPRALIQLEIFISNWLIRSAELISEEVLAACGAWPELRGYLLNQNLISTRELERIRNQLNSQKRWQYLIQRPIQLYESKRLYYQINQGVLEKFLITEPRDNELRKLGWWQQQVALLVEIRDALAPQLQALFKKVGDLLVVVLTQVIGRAIGLIGRGIAQGMGRSLGRS